MKTLALNHRYPAVVITAAAFALGCFIGATADEPAAPPLRAGMIGLDTSHVPAFARLFNEAKSTDESKRRGGVPVSLPEVLAKARAEGARRK
jgi:hypothetical protein